jgi:hypothetical protein
MFIIINNFLKFIYNKTKSLDIIIESYNQNIIIESYNQNIIKGNK